MAASSIPIRLVHEAKGEAVSVELENGESYAGRLMTVDDNMNLELENVTVTDKKGRTRETPSIFLRGSMVTFVALPKSLPVAPLINAAVAAQQAAAEAAAAKPPSKRDRA